MTEFPSLLVNYRVRTVLNLCIVRIVFDYFLQCRRHVCGNLGKYLLGLYMCISNLYSRY
jgi:hypothetical protein